MNKKNTPPYEESHTSKTDMAHSKRQPPHIMGYGDSEGHSLDLYLCSICNHYCCSCN